MEPSLVDKIVSGADSKDGNPPLSKSQQKKLLKAARWEATKDEYKAKQREKKKANAKARKEAERVAREEQGLGDGEQATPGFKSLKRKEFLEGCTESCAMLIDCAWEGIHNDRSLTSLAQQLMFSYGRNRRAPKPSHFYITGVDDNLQAKLRKNNCEGWLGVTISQDDFKFPPAVCDGSSSSGASATCSSAIEGSTEDAGRITCDKIPVYLTSEAEDTLETLDSSHIYIIGGIVDRNAHKGVAYEKAKQLGLRTAKLPIKEHFPHILTVLTINHVVEILLKYNETQSWEQAIRAIIPERKRAINEEVVTALSEVVAEAEGAGSSGRRTVAISGHRKQKRQRPANGVAPIDAEVSGEGETALLSSS
jgi:tRNA (guanine9-N1)-methyltransferase